MIGTSAVSSGGELSSPDQVSPKSVRCLSTHANRSMSRDSCLLIIIIIIIIIVIVIIIVIIIIIIVIVIIIVIIIIIIMMIIIIKTINSSKASLTRSLN